MPIYSVDKLVTEARKLAVAYREATGQPLAISGEIARQDAARLLDLELVEPNRGGFDAIGRSGPNQGVRFQIKGRAIFDEGKSGQRIGQLKPDQPWDAVLLVLMDGQFEPTAIYQAERDVLEAELEEKKRKNKRGAMTVAKFRIIGHVVWTREDGVIEDELWDNRRDR